MRFLKASNAPPKPRKTAKRKGPPKRGPQQARRTRKGTRPARTGGGFPSAAIAALTPRRAAFGGAGALFLFLASGFIWLWHDGWFTRQSDALAAKISTMSVAAGLKLEDVQVMGRRRVRKETLLAVMGVKRDMPIFAIDPQDARAKLEALTWVKQAAVDRRLPNVLAVTLTEREPLALWQIDGELRLIDHDGEVIENATTSQFAYLPVIVGPGAPKNAPSLLALLDNEPDLKKRVTAAVWVSNRRWTLQLDGSIKVRLPEEDPAAALAQLLEIEREHGVFDKDVVTIDLRSPDRLVVRMAPGAIPISRSQAGEDT